MVRRTNGVVLLWERPHRTESATRPVGWFTAFAGRWGRSSLRRAARVGVDWCQYETRWKHL